MSDKRFILGDAARLRYRLAKLAEGMAAVAKDMAELAKDETWSLQEVVSLSADEITTAGEDQSLEETVTKAEMTAQVLSAFGKIDARDVRERRQKIAALLSEHTNGRPAVCDGPGVQDYLKRLPMDYMQALHGAMKGPTDV